MLVLLVVYVCILDGYCGIGMDIILDVSAIPLFMERTSFCCWIWFCAGNVVGQLWHITIHYHIYFTGWTFKMESTRRHTKAPCCLPSCCPTDLFHRKTEAIMWCDCSQPFFSWGDCVWTSAYQKTITWLENCQQSSHHMIVFNPPFCGRTWSLDTQQRGVQWEGGCSGLG